MPAQKQRHEIVVQIPDMGLSKDQITSLKKEFKNQFVSSLGEKRAAIIIVIVRIRIIRQIAEI
jgi:hypothetical protein